MAAETKRFKARTEELSKNRQLSGLFNIIGSNLLLATQVLSTKHRIRAVQELESLSRKARLLAKELMSEPTNLSSEDLAQNISSLKQKMLALVITLTNELNNFVPDKNKNLEDIILAKRLLRDTQRGLATIQD